MVLDVLKCDLQTLEDGKAFEVGASRVSHQYLAKVSLGESAGLRWVIEPALLV